MPNPIELIEYAKQVARQAGIDEKLFIGLIAHESGFKADPGGNGGGIGQFRKETAEGYGVTQEQLRKDPKLGLRVAARLLQDNYKAVGNDWTKAAAAYFVGSGNIQQASQGGGNWIAAADKIAGQYGQGSVTQYLKDIGLSDTLASTRGQLGARPAGRTGATAGDLPPPNIESYRLPDPITGELSGDYDYGAYYQALTGFRELSKGKSDETLADRLALIEADLGYFDAELEAGRLNVTKASQEFQQRLDSYKAANAPFESAMGYLVPMGATHFPGTDKPLSGPPVEWNPLKMALDMRNGLGTPDLTTIPTPQAPSRNLFAEALDMARARGATGAAQPDTTQPAQFPRDNPPPAPNTSIAPGMASTAGGDAEAIRLAQMFAGGGY